VAALFAVHPLHVESVAWVAERKDVLSTFFWMLAMAAYVRYVDHPGLKNYVPVIVLFALGLMAKPMLVTLPFVLLLLDYWPLQRLGLLPVPPPSAKGQGKTDRPSPAKKRKDKPAKNGTGLGIARSSVLHCALRGTPFSVLLLEKIPLFALAALSCIVTYVVQQKGGAVKSVEAFPPGVRIANALVSYVIYIGKTVWPSDLAVFYPHPGSLPLWQVLGAALMLIAVTFIVVLRSRRLPCLAVGWLWFAGTLVPVAGIVQVGRQAMADRYTYIPLIGLFIMAAWGIPGLVEKWRHHRATLFASSACIFICLFIVTWTQLGYWRDSISLYDHALQATRPNDIILNSRGDAYCRLGNLERAIPDFDEAVEINPGNFEAYYNRGVTYGKLGNHRQAISDFGRAIEIDPGREQPYYNRGFAYGELGDYREAIENYNKAIEIRPEDAEAHISRGVAYGKLGDLRQAISDYDRAIEINPQHAMAYNNRGFTYGRLGNYGQAIEDLDRAIQLDPGYAKAYCNRAFAHAELGHDEQAIEDLKTAARFDNEEAKNVLRSQGMSW